MKKRKPIFHGTTPLINVSVALITVLMTAFKPFRYSFTGASPLGVLGGLQPPPPPIIL